MLRRRLSQLICYFALSGSLRGVLADTAITVDAQDTSIIYHMNQSVSGPDAEATWVLVQRSSDSCDTPQMLTSRLGDSMTFSFIGTGIYIIGTTGRKGGLIDFSLDGVNMMTNFSRQNPALICDQILFNKLDLTLQQHTVVATLVGQQINLGTGQLDGVLSVQRVRYTIPAQMSSSIDIVPIICVILAVVGLNAASGLAYFLWRRRHPKPRRVVSSTARTGGDSLPEDRNDTRLAMFGFRLPRKRRGDRTLTQSQAEDDAAELGPLTRTSPVTNRSEKSSEP